ncbi:DEAD/DEAH box helicase [Thermodesulfobacteriota bacterium]
MINQTTMLSKFHPIVAEWFTKKFSRPTEVQERGWQKIEAGEHVLITAPTGSGKTLTAFLWAINQLIAGELDIGHTRILYVSPLKALNNDIQQNLLGPLMELRQGFEEGGRFFPDIRVQTRSGDTTQSERRYMLRHPPEILITTPESLNLILSSSKSMSILSALSTVILDEIHGVVGNKRGVHLITAVDRIVPLAGDFQRIALSATIRPLETVAEFVGGFRVEEADGKTRYKARPVSIIHTAAKKNYDVRISCPVGATDGKPKGPVWESLVPELKRIVGNNRSTLIFVNNRGLCEKLTLKINHGEELPVAYAHHGSLSREIRREVERKLKEGELRAIVATSSLEMGIDIGSLDEVLLIQTPTSVSSAIQRVGRAGHQVGEVSRAAIFPLYSLDFIEAAALISGIHAHDIEAVRPVQCPLDVLAQVIISMVSVELWDTDALYAQLKTSYPYRKLSRRQFDLILNMLAGRYADSRIRELAPQISLDGLDKTVAARKRALLALYTSGGTIPNRGYFHLRHHETNARIGELDEEFVWEASIGQNFTLGTQNWKIKQITHNDVFVIPAHPKSMSAPFWKGEANNRDFHYSMQIARFLEMANECLENPGFPAWLQDENHMDAAAAEQLIGMLIQQKEVTKCDLPHRHHFVVERVNRGPGFTPGNQVVLHTFWGGRVNRPYAMALEAAWEKRFGQRLEIYAGNDCITLLLPHDISGDELLSLVSSGRIEKLLRYKLEGSGFFGARFRECAGRALLLTRPKISERMPLWMSRLRSKKLLDAVSAYEDFPILLEAWRTCLQDEFDLEGLGRMMAELESGTIRWSEVDTSRPSPMAQGMTWRQINQYMYMGDEPVHPKSSKLHSDLLRDVVFSPHLRPVISRQLVKGFELKRKRLSAGYSPSTSRDLLDWAKERILMPESEWKQLLRNIENDHGIESGMLINPIAEKLVKITPSLAAESLIVALEVLPRVISTFYDQEENVSMVSLAESMVKPGAAVKETQGGMRADVKTSFGEDEDLLSPLLDEWLQFYGPTTTAFVHETLGLDKGRLLLTLEALNESQQIITGKLVKGGSEDGFCDAENFEVLLRLSRADAVPVFQPLETDWLPLFLACYQGLTKPERNADGLHRRVEQLLCYHVPAHQWESEILPARMRAYDPSWLDSIMQEGDLRWLGNEKHHVAFCFESELDLIQEDPGGREAEAAHSSVTEVLKKNNSQRDKNDLEEEPGDLKADQMSDIFPDRAGRYDFYTLLRKSTLRPAELAAKLWDGVWQGGVSNDTFIALRRGIENRFRIPDMTMLTRNRHPPRRRSGRRTGFLKWKETLPFAGNWFRLPGAGMSIDLLEKEEIKKERVRLLLDRYGILFREMLQKEQPIFNWSTIFRSLRLMELSGEVLSGCFFNGIPGPQFISQKAFRLLQRNLPEDVVYWLNAADPASLCGIPLDEVKGKLPKRLESNHLVYRGRKLVMVSRGYGRNLHFYVTPEDAELPKYMGPLRHLFLRRFRPKRRLTIETINGREAHRSPYLDLLRISFDINVDFRKVTLFGRNKNMSDDEAALWG